jgi:transcriptional regulator of acetoin/glycerol metabolism
MANEMVSTAATKERFLAGETLPAGLLSDVITRSWQRCVAKGMQPGRAPGDLRQMTPRELAGARAAGSQLILHSQPVMEHLYEQIAGTSSVVVLADATGRLLHTIGDPDFEERTNVRSLRSGGIWSEDIRGTNAIGTALVERSPVIVHSAEHFIDTNNVLTCSASPIFDPHGQMLGILNVSGDCGAFQRHTMALVRMSAQMIENNFFAAGFDSEIQIHFHLRKEFVGTLYEGIAVFSPEGRFIAGNRAALVMLGLDRYGANKLDFTRIFDLSMAKLFEQSRLLPQPIISLRLYNGVELFGRVKFGLTVSPVTFLPVQEEAGRQRFTTEKKQHGGENPIESLELGDQVMRAAIQKALKVAAHDIPIMIEGESGTGKEVFARAIHDSGPRKASPFIAINCAAIPEGLIESELFGYRDGAFTGARRSGNIGKIQQADGGTLFLDEIGDMPLSLQARLLRVLQDHTVTPLGGAKSAPVDIAVICATNRRLRDEVAAGRFREDLYYRLNGLLVTLPPLRNRDDRLALANWLLARQQHGEQRLRLSQRVAEIFEHHPWPGNIRQLVNIIRMAIVLGDEEKEITVEHLTEDFLEQYHGRHQPSRLLAEHSGRLEDVELSTIRDSLRECSGNVSAAARKLGISRNTLYRKMKDP